VREIIDFLTGEVPKGANKACVRKFETLNIYVYALSAYRNVGRKVGFFVGESAD
jgi:hypothetical protein